MLKYKNLEIKQIIKNYETQGVKIPLSGIFQLHINENVEFEIITINNDDTSVVDRFWNRNHKDFVLEKWCEWSQDKGVYIDIGAHTGIYTLSALKANPENRVIAFEPFVLNFHRIITNLRLNNYDNNSVSLFNAAVTNENKIIKFEVITPWSYLSKGGKISNQGVDTKAIKLDSLKISKSNLKINAIKIDTEGEDLNVLLGAKNIISNHKPKIIVETRQNNVQEIISFLSDLGYNKIYDEDNIKKTKINLMNFRDKQTTKDIFFEKID